MLKGKKISNYKIKKILKCYVEDFSVTEAAANSKINRNTVSRYYHFFRKILSNSYNFFLDKKEKNCSNCLGVYKSQYIKDNWIKAYKFNGMIFLRLFLEEPGCKRNSVSNQEFRKFLDYFNIRASKFYGFNSKKSYYYQVIETIYRHYYSEDKLFSFIWKSLLAQQNNNRALFEENSKEDCFLAC